MRFGKLGDGGCGLPRARSALAMTWFFYKGCGVRRDTWVPPYSRAFCRAGPVCPAGGREKNPPGTASPCQPPLGKGAMGTGERMSLLRCPKFLRCLTADAGNFDRGHSLTSLPLPPAALSSLPTASVRTGFAMTEAERICVSFRDQSADWSWESVIPLCKSKGERIATPVTSVTGSQ